MIPARRPLEDMIGELAESLLAIGGDAPVRPTGIALSLPVEAFVERGPAGARVIADLPRLNTRTYFDLPVGKLTLTLGEVVTGAAA